MDRQTDIETKGKVLDLGTNRKCICNFLLLGRLVLNGNMNKNINIATTVYFVLIHYPNAEDVTTDGLERKALRFPDL